MENPNGTDKITGYKNLTVEDVKSFIQAAGIEMIRLEYMDLNGINRGKLLPSDMIDAIFEDGIAFAAAVMALCFDNSVVQVKGFSEY